MTISNNLTILLRTRNSSSSWLYVQNEAIKRRNWPSFIGFAIFGGLFGHKQQNKQQLQQCIQNDVENLKLLSIEENPKYANNLLNLAQLFNTYLHNTLQEINKNKLIYQLKLNADHYFQHDNLQQPINCNFAANSDKDATEEDPSNLIQIDHKGRYTDPYDEQAHQHGAEAVRIFWSTQTERFKVLLHKAFATIGLRIFENSTYFERKYIDTDIYATDCPINYNQNTASHYWIGHATNLFRIPITNTDPATTINILTDPVEGELNALFYPRKTKPARHINAKQADKFLPKIDVILISHNHRDHLDIDTLKKLLPQQPLIIVPEGDLALIQSLGFTNIRQLKCSEHTKINITDCSSQQLIGDITIHAVAAKHWSNRGPIDAHKSAFNGYVIQSPALPENADIFFAGDTGMLQDEQIQSIATRFNIGTYLAPGGPDENRADMQSTHQSSADGIVMHFKILEHKYKSQLEDDLPSKDKFMQECAFQLKTIYNHTATFKLGNLHLHDTLFSVNKIKMAFKHNNDDWAKNNLCEYELKAYLVIQGITNQMQFRDNAVLDNNDIFTIIEHMVTIPKIGQRSQLTTPNPRSRCSYRNLPVNKYAAQQYDRVLQQIINKEEESITAKQLIIALLNYYNKAWHANITKTHFAAVQQLLLQIEEIDAKEPQKLQEIVNQFINDTQNINKTGHMATLLTHAMWLIDLEQQSLIDDIPIAPSNHNHSSSELQFEEIELNHATLTQQLQLFFNQQQFKYIIDVESKRSRANNLFSRNGKDKNNIFAILANTIEQHERNNSETADYTAIYNDWKNTEISDALNYQQLLQKHRNYFWRTTNISSSAALQQLDTLANKISTPSA